MTSDEELLRLLRAMWDEADPVPDTLADRVLFTIEVRDLHDLRNMEFELLRMTETLSAAGARAEAMPTVTFTGAQLSIMVTLSRSDDATTRLDGWIIPAAGLRVELRTSRKSLTTVSDADGRFAFADVRSGLVQLVIHPAEGSAIVLAQPVVTPAVEV